MTRRSMLLFAAMSVLWGIPYLLIKVAVRDLDPVALVFCRTGIGAVVLLPLALARGTVRPVLARWRPLVVYTMVELAIPWVLLSEAERHLSSSVTGLLVAAVPLVGAVLAGALGTRLPLGPRAVTGLIVGLVGVAVLVGFHVGAAGGSLAMVGVVVVGYAVGPAILSRSLSDVPALGVVATSLTLCAIAYAPLALTHLPAATPPARVIVAVVVLGVACTAVAFVLFIALIGEIGPVRATVITYVNPAIAVVLGVLFLHEDFGAATAAGFVLILAGSILATRSSTSLPSGAVGVGATEPRGAARTISGDGSSPRRAGPPVPR